MTFGESSAIVRDIPPSCLLKMAKVEYNIHQCVGLDGRRDVARIARVLGGLNAQLIGLQEVGTDTEDGRKSSQPEYLPRATGLQAIAGPTIER